jgi:hypothetical protein
MGTAKTIFAEVVQGYATGSYVTGSDVGDVGRSRYRYDVLRMPIFFPRFLSY